MLLKTTTILLILVGEAFTIVAELIASKRVAADTAHYASIFGLMFLLFTLGGALIVAGYMLGYLHFKNIWIITALSLGTILVVEPLLAYLVFHQLPTTGAVIGLVLGVSGIFSSLFL